MSEWTTARLGPLCLKVGSGATPRGGKESYKETGISLIRSQNVYNNRFEKAGLAFIDEKQAESLSSVEVESRDVLLNITGDSVARACQVPDGVLPARVNQHVAIIRPDADRLDPGFLRYWLVSPQTQAHMLSLASAGATRKALTKGMIEEFEVPLPGISTQQTIAHILETLDDKIELNRRMNRTLEAIARAIFKSWFVDFDPVHDKAEGREPVGIDPETAALLPDSFQDSPLGKIPKGWELLTVGDLCNRIENGGTPARKEGNYWGGSIPWFKTGELTDGVLLSSEEKITERGLEKSSCKLWPRGTILVALYASPTVGRLGLLTAPAAANQACSGLQADSAYGTEFLFHSLLATRERLQRVAVGAAQQNISQQVVREHKLVCPPTALAQAFGDRASGLREPQTNLAQQSTALAEIRDALLPQLLSGFFDLDQLAGVIHGD